MKMPCWCQRRMGRLVRDDRKTTVTQITTRYNQGMQNTISEHTTRRTLKQMGSSSRRPHRVKSHKAQIISDWFLEHDNEFTLLKWPPQSPDLNPIEHLWDVVEREIHIMDVQSTNLQQLREVIMSIWTKISEEFSNTLLNLCHEELRQFWRQKGVQHGTSNVYLIKWPVCMCIYISGGPLSALTCCVNVRLLSAIKKISPLIYSQSWVGSWVYTTQAMMTFTLIF